MKSKGLYLFAALIMMGFNITLMFQNKKLVERRDLMVDEFNSNNRDNKDILEFEKDLLYSRFDTSFIDNNIPDRSVCLHLYSQMCSMCVNQMLQEMARDNVVDYKRLVVFLDGQMGYLFSRFTKMGVPESQIYVYEEIPSSCLGMKSPVFSLSMDRRMYNYHYYVIGDWNRTAQYLNNYLNK